MIDPKKIEQIARQVHESMPKGLRDLGEDVEKKIRQVLQSQLTRLDLVSREEFDVQTQVLLRTREKLALLEQRLNDLESRSLSASATPDAEEKPQALQKHGASLRRQTAKRFIQYQYPGLHGKRAGNDYPLGFSAGERGRVAMT